MCAAIAAARRGAKTAIVQDRPVFGGNASSEVRMWICGAHGAHNNETGILEEIQLENQYRNLTGNFSVWDSVLNGKIAFQPNLMTFLNCSCTDAEMDGDRIVCIKAWQSTTQTWHRIQAKYFIDCSGDSILAAVTNAEFRVGREARAEFDEDIQPATADRKTMGNTLLIQARHTNEAQPFIPPPWAYKFTSPADLQHRVNGVSAHNFWWIEVGGLQDTIRDAESIRDELMKITYGVWDYLKNHSPERAKIAGMLATTFSRKMTFGLVVLSRTSSRTAAGRWTIIIRPGCSIPVSQRFSTRPRRRTAFRIAVCTRAIWRTSFLLGAIFR